MKFSFSPEAELEFNDAIEYYEECSKGLGIDFTMEVHMAIERIIAYPLAWIEIEKEIRRIQINRFPYGILYSIEDNTIYILAIMNLHRTPSYWKQRI